MYKIISVGLFVCINLVVSLSAEAQRATTIQSIVYGSTKQHALNICKNGSGGNIVVLVDAAKEKYNCYFDTNTAIKESKKSAEQSVKKPSKKRTFRTTR